MKKKLYVLSFVVLAIIFVPVVIYYFLGILIAPCCYLIVTGLGSGWDLGGAIFGGTYLSIYLGLFYALARISFLLSDKIPKLQLKLFIQICLLLAVFGCSFLRVNVDAGMGGSTGTYNFWGACARYMEIHHTG